MYYYLNKKVVFSMVDSKASEFVLILISES